MWRPPRSGASRATAGPDLPPGDGGPLKRGHAARVGSQRARVRGLVVVFPIPAGWRWAGAVFAAGRGTASDRQLGTAVAAVSGVAGRRGGIDVGPGRRVRAQLDPLHIAPGECTDKAVRSKPRGAVIPGASRTLPAPEAAHKHVATRPTSTSW